MKISKTFPAIVLTVFILLGSYGCGCRHKYESSITKQPTCAEPGEITYTCRLCGYVYKESISKTNEHSYVSQVTKEPAAKTTGIRTYTCTVCGASYTEPIDRVYVWKEAYYVDEFGDDTDLRYVYGKFDGTFSGPSASDSPLTVYVYIDCDDSRMTVIKLFKFKQYKVSFTDFHTVTLKTKDPSGAVRSYSVFLDEGDVCCSDKELSDMIIGTDGLAFSISATSDFQTTPETYVFKTENTGLAALINKTP